jgi:hypothetical protein
MLAARLVIAFLLSTVVISSSAAALDAPDTYAFAGLSWGASEDTVRSKLAEKYTFRSKDKDGDLLFGGTIDGEDVSIVAYMSKGALARVVVVVEPDNNAMLRTYIRFKSVLSTKYGKPTDDDRYFSNPYEYGDGYEEQAVRNNKGSLSTKWRTALDGSSLGMLVFKTTSVRIFYDTPVGVAEEKERSSRSTSDL